MKKMIHVYKEGEDRVVELNGKGATILDDFAVLCGTLVNKIIEGSGVPEDKVVSVLSMTMAQGISERKEGRI